VISSDDLTQMQGDLAAVRGDRSEDIVIRRGHGTGLTELPAQTVRIARIVAQGRVDQSATAEQAEGRAVVLGTANMDVKIGDRFNDAGGRLYEVVYIRPNRSVATMFEAIVVE
jgi:hypothetical protein